jgi:hypothetical protein
MSWYKELLSTSRNKPATISNFGDLNSLIAEVYNEKLTEKEKSLVSEDFIQNTLFEIFSGIDYTRLSRTSLNEGRTLKQILKEDQELTDEEIRLGLPKLRISEDWGNPESNDRQIIQRFSSAITGETLQDKLATVNNVATGQVQMASLGQILGTLVVLECLYTILAQFTESAGGFIFEGFLAGLFGEDAVQITDVGEDSGEATGKPITDVELGGREYSLKLLGPTTAVKGSWKNMTEHFASGRDHVVYLDARRSGRAATDSLVFGEFVITMDNFIKIFYDPFRGFKSIEVKFKNKEELVSAMEEFGEQLFFVKFDSKAVVDGKKVAKANFKMAGVNGPPVRELLMNLIQQVEELPSGTFKRYEEDYTKASQKVKKLWGDYNQFQTVAKAIETYAASPGDKTKEGVLAALRNTAGYKNKEQFEFSVNQAEGLYNFEHIGSLLLGEEQLKKTWMLYADILKKTITPVYMSMARFNENVSNYFMGAEGSQRKAFALAAQQELGTLKEATDEAISAVEQSEKDEYTPEKAAAE